MTRWSPDDDELDAVARGLPGEAPDDARAEQGRTAVLAAAAIQKQRSRSSPVPQVAAAIAIAAAASLAIWTARRTPPPAATVASAGAPQGMAASPAPSIVPVGAARFERLADGADTVVRVDDGTVAVQVPALAGTARFRIKTADAEVEVRGGAVEVGVATGRLMSVVARGGRVELRTTDQHVVLSGGQRWVRTAPTRDEIELPAPPAPAPPSRDESELPAPAPPPPSRVATGVPPPLSSVPNRVASGVPPSPPPSPAPGAPPSPPPLPSPATERLEIAGGSASAAPPASGEAEFRAGWDALRKGDAASAATAFATACREASSDAIGEDACFWAGAAAKRAGAPVAARTQLARFVERFPASSRAPEAAALLGWLLYDAGELDAAARQFHRAEHDRVPQVRDSARRGLTAIERLRKR